VLLETTASAGRFDDVPRLSFAEALRFAGDFEGVSSIITSSSDDD